MPGLTFLLALFISGTGDVFAEGDAVAGKTKASACQICHGTGGHNTDPTYPILAGQHAQYIEKQLRAFKDGTRKDPIMNNLAATLTEQDIQDISAFFQSSR